AAGMLWIMDASINVSMEPFRAFVGDNLPASQRTIGFAMQSFFIGIGAVVASALPFILDKAFGISSEPLPGEQIGASVRYSFYLGGIVFLLAVLWTIFRSFEYSPEELAEFEGEDEFQEEEHPASFYKEHGAKILRTGLIILAVGVGIFIWLLNMDLDKQLFIFAGFIALAGLLAILAGWMQRGGKHENSFVTIINDFSFMPATMKQLAAVQFFSWFGLFAMWIYTTGAVTSHIYGTTDTHSAAYNEGANMVGLGFAIYNGVTFLVAFLIPMLAKQVGRRVTHLICLTLGGLGLISIYFIPDVNMGIFSMIGVGIAWASILSIPYAILAGSLPASKMGYYMGVFNFFIVIPQLVAAALLGGIVKFFFDGEPIYALIVGGCSLILSGLLTLRVKDAEEAVLLTD
ncbi:MAG: hypothetical protein KDC44_19115, partial [Phaeodactylibacter sp.]|nr:hypothetical protein [Phaeodactylibacter sp.]